MKGFKRVIAVSAIAPLLMAGVAMAQNNPVQEKWWPSELGADDEAGGTGYITAQKRIEAAKLVKKGKIALLGHPYSNHMPLVPGRTFALSIPRHGTARSRMRSRRLPWRSVVCSTPPGSSPGR